MILLTGLSRISNILKHLFDKLRRGRKSSTKASENAQLITNTELSTDSLNTLMNERKSLIEERQRIHQKIRDLDKKYKEGKISLTERDDNILTLLKKGVKLRKEIEKISKEIDKLEGYS